MNLNLFFEKLQQRPRMYFDDVSITSLYTFLVGFFIGKQLSNCFNEEDSQFLSDFYPYLKNKYNVNGANWKELLLNLYDGDNQLAYNNFFQHYKEFIQSVK